ncbi:MAG TPA: carboxypeptidase-like regulatory domain-containing protein [Planctomycetota bacterium]|nr:carboxypeptidase-like regulatory domain-containing protein [Planctomycetota bacterium]
MELPSRDAELAAPAIERDTIGPEPGGDAQSPALPELASGRGRLRVRLAGDASGERWFVSLAPWRLHLQAPPGSVRQEPAPEGAVELVIELPLGSYAVRAIAGSRSSHVVRADLSQAAPEAALELALLPLVEVLGTVLTSVGEPAADLQVFAEDAAGQLLATSPTDTLGRFQLPGLPAGPCRIGVGSPAGAILPRLEVEARAPRLVVAEPIALPSLAELAIEVVDPSGTPVSLAPIHGWRDGGGHFALSADGSGAATARHLLPGLWRVHAESPGVGRGNRHVELAAGETGRIGIVLREKP